MANYKFGICDWRVPLSGVTSISLASELGFDGLQISDFGGEKRNFPLCQPWVQRQFLEPMDRTGIIIDVMQLNGIIEAGQISCHPDTPEGKRGLEAIKKTAQACQVLRIPRVLIGSMDLAHVNHIQNNLEFKNGAAFFRAAAEILGDAGVTLVFETFSSVERTLEFYEQCEHCFRLCYDTLNPLGFGFGDPREELPVYFNQGIIDHIHFKDMPENYELSTAALGEGVGYFQECSQIIRAHGYEGWLVTENNYGAGPLASDDPIAAMKKDLESMKRQFA